MMAVDMKVFLIPKLRCEFNSNALRLFFKYLHVRRAYILHSNAKRLNKIKCWNEINKIIAFHGQEKFLH